MFDKSTKELYESVKAPESLKSRVENMAAQAYEKENAPKAVSRPFLGRKRFANAAYTLAACAAAVAIFFASHMRTPDAPVLLVNGENPAAQTVTLELTHRPARFALDVQTLDVPTETVSMVLSLETNVKTEISVSRGAVSDMLSGKPATALTFSEDAKIYWDIEDITADETAYLTVKNAETGTVFSEYAVEKDEQTGNWLVRQIQK